MDVTGGRMVVRRAATLTLHHPHPVVPPVNIPATVCVSPILPRAAVPESVRAALPINITAITCVFPWDLRAPVEARAPILIKPPVKLLAAAGVSPPRHRTVMGRMIQLPVKLIPCITTPAQRDTILATGIVLKIPNHAAQNHGPRPRLVAAPKDIFGVRVPMVQALVRMAAQAGVSLHRAPG